MKTVLHNTLVTIAAAMALCASFSIPAADNMGKMDMKAPVAAAVALTNGDIRKVDEAAGEIVIKHGPIINLQMPAMTMAYSVASPAMLAQVKAGDKVRFHVEMLKGVATITRIEVAN